MKICKIKGCLKKYKAKGYCKNHYTNFLRAGNPLGKRRSVKNKCSVKGCRQPYKAKGYCKKHYKNFIYSGHPLGKRYRYRNIIK